jgi:uncharacterized protein YndB with AHSA1/START domain
MSGAYRSFAHRVDIDVPVQRVWRAFTDSRVLERWTTRGARVTPREKGSMQVSFAPGFELDGHIDVLVTPQRMRLILLPTKGMPASGGTGADAVIVEDFLFERSPQGTTVRLLSSGVPSAQAWVTYYLQKRRHWELALTRLKVFLEKGLDERQPESRY